MARSRHRHSLRRLVGFVAASTLLLLPGTAALGCSHAESPGAPREPEPVIAQTYRSASAEYSLHVEPSDPTGRCPAKYTLRHKGELLWERQLDFTLTAVVLSDQGFTLGYNAPAPEVSREVEREVFVAILDVEGKTLHRQTHPFLQTSPIPAWRRPNPLGLVVQNELRRGILRIFDRGGRNLHEFWWVYDLESGKRTARFSVESRFARQRASGPLRLVEELAGTPFLLVRWAVRPKKKSREATETAFQFVALDERFRVRWELDSNEHDELLRRAPNGEFVVHNRAAELKIRLRAVPDRKSWEIRELARESFKDPNPPPKDPEPLRRGP